jgi:hypothetical protein
MTTPSTFAVDLLTAIGLPTTKPWQDVINTWAQAEGGFNPANSLGAAQNNPLNTHAGGFPYGVTGGTTNGETLEAYPDLGTAVQSYAYGLKNYSYYTKIVASTTPAQLAQNIISSDWAQGHYVDPATGKLSDAWTSYFRGANVPIPVDGTLPPVPVGGAGGGKSVPPGTVATADPNPLDPGNILTGILKNILPGVFGGPGSSGGSGVGGPLFDTVVNVLFLLVGVILLLFGLYALVRPGASWKGFGRELSELGLGVAAEGYLASRERGNTFAQPSAATAALSPDTAPATPDVQVDDVASGVVEPSGVPTRRSDGARGRAFLDQSRVRPQTQVVPA